MKSAIQFEEEGYTVDFANANSKKFYAQYLVAQKTSPCGYTLDYWLKVYETRMVTPEGKTVWLYEATGQDADIFKGCVREDRDEAFECVKEAFDAFEKELMTRYGSDDVQLQ